MNMSLSEEEENYVRISLLLTGLSPRAVRVLFDREFPPTYLPSILNQKYNTLLSLQKSRVINQAQWNLMFPPRSGVADSKTFDVTLMICLIRNLTSIAPPALGFDRLPSTVEATPGSDIARIKYYRNYLAHLDDNKIDNSDFTTAWNDISDALGRLGGSSMYQECQDLKTKLLDNSNKEIMLEFQNLKSSHHCLKDDVKNKQARTKKELKKLKTGHQQFTEEIKMLKDTVPWNIREQMTTKLENWKKEDQICIETRAASHILQSIKINSCVTVTASSGVGKTFTVRHVALQMADDGYDILPIINPEDIVKYHNPNKKTLYVIDDLCGIYAPNQTYLDKWKTMHGDIKGLLENYGTKIIASCRLQVFKDEQFKLLPLFTACECNLLLPNMSLSKKEKQLIAAKYLKSDAFKISQYIDLFDFFPLLCKLYNEHQALNVVDFFKSPFSVYEEEIDKLQKEKAHGKYCALALCVIFNNRLKEEWLTDDVNQDIRQIIENTCEACRLNRGTPRLVLKDELDSLIHTFLKKEQGFYCTIHDKLFDFLSFYFAKTQMITWIIKNGNGRLISERLVFKKETGSDQFITIVPDKYQKMYIERMLDDWSKGKVVTVFNNINMKSLEFRNIFLSYLKNVDISYQKQLAGKSTAHVSLPELYENGDIISSQPYHPRMNTPLLSACALGDIKMVEWCCSCGADVNYCSANNISPLCIACKGGHTDIVTKLVDSKADINKCNDDGESPLYIACDRGYTDIVTTLVDNKADINKCGTNGLTPLNVACNGGYTNIVTKLLDNKADINKGLGVDTLIDIACDKRYPDIVTKLVDNMSDINMDLLGNKRLLFIACSRGYADIVNKLVDYMADINEDYSSGESPLFLACKGGYINIVTKLMDNKADINKCDIWRQTPLYIACKKRYTNIVTKLLDNKADINKCTKYKEESPLFIACKKGYTDIVTKLLDNKANINMCAQWGKSPLYVACKKGYTDIVSKLLDNKADVNKCINSGESPLYIACKGDYTDIVTKLVYNKADINNCSNFRGESLLLIACKGGYTEIVNKLLENKIDMSKETQCGKLVTARNRGYIDRVSKLMDKKADINQCERETGESPLYLACKGGYTDIVTKLVVSMADINKCTKDGTSPLHIACKGGYADIVTTLVANKADINNCTQYGESPLYIACKGGYTGIVTELVDNKTDVNKCTNSGESPLYKACKGEYTDIVTKLVDKKADVNKCTNSGESPLYIACKGEYTDIVTKLVDNKADINKCTNSGESPLYIACNRGYTNIVTKLLDKKADINKRECLWGQSPLYIACMKGYTDIVTRLVENKADINKCTREFRESPLYIACMKGYSDIVTLLVNNKADINTCTKYNASPLHVACQGGYTDIVTKLVDNKAEINMCQNRTEKSPLYIACKGGHTDIVTKLVDSNADINKCTKDGKSPLYIACKRGFIQIVKILISKGANHTTYNNEGQSALDIARRYSHDNIVEFITQHSFVQ